MKPEPYIPPLPRRLTDHEQWLLEVSAAGGVHAILISGAARFRSARALVQLGLGEIDGHNFKATLAGLRAIGKY